MKETETMRKLIAFGILSCIALGLSAPSAAAQVLQLERQREAGQYIIQPNDVLDIYVWKQNEMSRKVTVLPDGYISIPTVQSIKAAGLTATELKQKLEEALKGVLEVPDVTVIVDSIRSYTVCVAGRVAKQGCFLVEKPISLLMAIAQAGGFTDYAKVNELVIVRGHGEDSAVINADFREIIRGTNPYTNLLLKSGDIVYVQ
jgi:polysaccharide export outer membrane protein